MSVECFDRRYWRVIESNTAECTAQPPSLVTFTTTDEKVTVSCDGRTPYGVGTATYDAKTNTIQGRTEGPEGFDYVIRFLIVFEELKTSVPVAGSWTAEDYVPPDSAPEPAGE